MTEDAAAQNAGVKHPGRRNARPSKGTGARPEFPATPDPVRLSRFAAADDLRAAIGLWSAWLAGERRASAHTIAAYGRDLAAFLDFLTEHLGAVPDLAAVDGLRPADFRAYLSRRAGDGVERSSLARNLSVLRNFVRFLQRRGFTATTALTALRSPKLPPGVPKPLSVEDAVAAVDAAGELAPQEWQRKRDTALLALLYGCGLRLSEALSLTRAEAPLGEALTVTGKGGKRRQLPVLPVVREAVADYLAACPVAARRRTPRYLSGRVAGHCIRAWCRVRWRRCAVIWGCR